eukprot:2815971-Pyramimonas_sp.AAC.1
MKGPERVQRGLRGGPNGGSGEGLEGVQMEGPVKGFRGGPEGVHRGFIGQVYTPLRGSIGGP